MQLSYNVIKNDQVSTNTTYTIKPVIIPLKQEMNKSKGDIEFQEDPGIDMEEAIADAQIIKEQAMQKAKEILSSATKEAERIKKDVYELSFKKGYNEGHAEGLRRGLEEGMRNTESKRFEAENVLKEAHRASREYIGNTKDEILTLSLHIAEKITGIQSDIHDETILNVVKKAIDAAIAKEQVVVRVNSMDYALLDCRRDEIEKLLDEKVSLSIINDQEVTKGGCIIETESGLIDASIESQLDKVKQLLSGR